MRVWVRVLASPRHSLLAFVVRVFGVGFPGKPDIPGWGLGCVCLGMGFGCAPPTLAGVGGACVGVRAFPAPRFSWLGCWGVCPLARAPPVPRVPRVGLPVARGCVQVAVGRASPPSFFCGLPGRGGGVCGCGSRPCRVVALWYWPSPISVLAPLVSASPPPFVWVVFFPRLRGRWPVTSPVGLCAGVPGVSLSPALWRLCGCDGPLFLAGRLQAGRGGPPVSYQRAPWVSPLVVPGGGSPASVDWVRSFTVARWSPPLSFCPAGPWVCARDLVGLPPFCVFFPFFWGGGGRLPVPPSAFPGLVHALVSKRCG